MNLHDIAYNSREVNYLLLMDGARDPIDTFRSLELCIEDITNDPYNVVHYLTRASTYRTLGYPDLAVGDAYKALLLVDEISDESEEYHDLAKSSFDESKWELTKLQNAIYGILIQSLTDCKCFRSALTFAKQWKRTNQQPDAVRAISNILILYREEAGILKDEELDVNKLPDNTTVRREIYPWNQFEPDRNGDEYLSSLNVQLEDVAPKCEVRIVRLPVLTGGSGITTQLGLFAKENIRPGENVLEESSILTANNNLHDTLCDACSAELPQLEEASQCFSCSDCDDIVFCSKKCLDTALELYHPAVCGKDIDSIARDSDPKEASDALYFLLLARAIAMAETQEIHPLELKETSSLWGDFATVEGNVPAAKPSLPFSFSYNVLYPIHLLTQMDLDIYATTAKYDFWIFNTLYAKFRGVASGRTNARTGKPEVCAVHPLWCLANHSCAPNVSWEWSGDIKLIARPSDQVCRWGFYKDDGEKWKGGIKAGEEVLNHYCDIKLDVKQRREWARGPLGGDCMCERCTWEAEHEQLTLGHLTLREASDEQSS